LRRATLHVALHNYRAGKTLIANDLANSRVNTACSQNRVN
jgi:hypothetical protein